MRGHENDVSRVGTGAFRDDVARAVDPNPKSTGREKLLQGLGAAPFVEFGRGDLRQANLLIGEPGGIVVNPRKAAGAVSILSEPRHGIFGRAGG
jgi:hypothetical protein